MFKRHCSRGILQIRWEQKIPNAWSAQTEGINNINYEDKNRRMFRMQKRKTESNLEKNNRLRDGGGGYKLE